jgi:hypothetical protein
LGILSMCWEGLRSMEVRPLFKRRKNIILKLICGRLFHIKSRWAYYLV